MAFNGTYKGPTGGFAHLLASISRALFAGLISSLIAAAYGLSFAALIFTGPLTPCISVGSLSAAEGREPIATSGLAHLHNCGDGERLNFASKVIDVLHR